MKDLGPAESQWLFTDADLDRTPSRLDGITSEDELRRRKKAIEYVRSIGLRAGLGGREANSPSARGVMAPAAMLVHRFYMRRSLKDFPEELVAPAMLFLASKIAEDSLKLRYIVNACLSKWEPGALPWEPDPNNKDTYPPQSLEYKRWEREILIVEELALEALCFDMAIINHWTIFRRAILNLNGEAVPKWMKVNGLELGWGLFNVIAQTPLVVTTHPHILAFGVFVILLAAMDDMSISSAIKSNSEASSAFTVDLNDETTVEQIKHFCARVRAYSSMDLIDQGLVDLIRDE
ncbi:cyclin-like protein [Kockovaella imperatae]|uniref:Cyclin-like protein n=1 Tax=Kockovaella imperatae TaxID=4999 RepID=A0A1Y1UP21_9TREE|nr:cyclin-like protein [Kockovaella imperatae]ORX39216.1 cyclin-like protein [Kockovaella imperatae]